MTLLRSAWRVAPHQLFCIKNLVEKSKPKVLTRSYSRFEADIQGNHVETLWRGRTSAGDGRRGRGRRRGCRGLHSLTSELNIRTFGTHRSLQSST